MNDREPRLLGRIRRSGSAQNINLQCKWRIWWGKAWISSGNKSPPTTSVDIRPRLSAFARWTAGSAWRATGDFRGGRRARSTRSRL